MYVGVCHATVLTTLLEDRMYLYRECNQWIPDVSTLSVRHFPCLNFACWYLQQTTTNQTFSANVLFTFTRSGIFNIRNSHPWAHDNLHDKITRANQVEFSIYVCAGTVHNGLVGLRILFKHLTNHTYSIFLQKTLLELLVDIPPAIR